jgi:two-component system nitrate/nitrite response regulator NarL
MCRVKIVVAESHSLSRYGLACLLDRVENFDAVGICSDGVETIQALREKSPEIALIDMSMPAVNGLEILSVLRLEGISTRVVLLAASIEDRDLVRAAAGGAYAIASKHVAPETLMTVLQETAAGELLPLAVVGDNLRYAQKCVTPTLLSARERQVVDLVSEGLSNKEVARRLNLSAGTVKVHLHRVYRKLSVSNRTALAISTVSDRSVRQIVNSGPQF